MTKTLCLTIRFIQPFPLFHGSRDGGEAEWPPSPMRVFQALLNAAALRSRGTPLSPQMRSALQMFEVHRPQIIAPRSTQCLVGYRAYVPHNQADLVTSAWHRGNSEASIAEHRIEKDYRPMRIETHSEELPTVHYLYSLDTAVTDPELLLTTTRPSIRAIHCLGWGIDQVVADATLVDSEEAAKFSGDRYMPAQNGGRPLRVPRQGSFDALRLRYDRFLTRLTGSDWTPVPPLTAFEQVRYLREDESTPRPHALFRLLDENGETARYPHAKLVHIAGMVRHLALTELEGMAPSGVHDSAEWLNRFVRGKAAPGDAAHQQLSYVPLPSIGHEHADAMIRNFLLIAPVGCERELEFVARRITGGRLSPEGDVGECEADSQPQGAPDSIERFTPPTGKFIDKHYLGASRVWHSVTPVILDGHDDKKPEKTVHLIRLALQRAGIEMPCEITWQAFPYLKNCLSAHKYDREGRPTGYHRPKHLKDQTAVHLRLTFEHPLPGPLTLGAGRHCGFGLMAAVYD